MTPHHPIYQRSGFAKNKRDNDGGSERFVNSGGLIGSSRFSPNKTRRYNGGTGNYFGLGLNESKGRDSFGKLNYKL